ncbi:MAG: hypothetical protein GY759_11525 [Chloroflexi bacterium]|nr:hypothetical protein [Chloroflexota bacterium]
MILKWGDHAHAQDEVGIKIEYKTIFDKFDRRIGDIQEWHIVGAVVSTTQAGLTTALSTLESAYSNDYRDLVMYLNDGTTATRHKLSNSDTFGGTHVAFFGYIEGPWKMQLEYANRRTFYIVIRAEVRTGGGQYAWKERLSVRGTGGQKFRYMPSLNAAPELQVLQQSSTYFYIQQGMAIGRQAYIIPPGPLYSSIEHLEQRKITYETPKEIRVNGSELYTTTWQYIMEGTTAAFQIQPGNNPFVWPSI